jgi:hypothetical protein
MNPERWQRIGELFNGAIRIDPARREEWLRAACSGDDELRAEVARLLAQDERADRVGFLTLPEPMAPPPESTTSWPPFPRRGLPATARKVPVRADALFVVPCFPVLPGCSRNSPRACFRPQSLSEPKFCNEFLRSPQFVQAVRSRQPMNREARDSEARTWSWNA